MAKSDDSVIDDYDKPEDYIKVKKDKLYISVEKRTTHKLGNSIGVTLPLAFVEKTELEKGKTVYLLSLLGGSILIVSDSLDWDFINSELTDLQEVLDYKLDMGELYKKTSKKDKGLF